MKDKEKLENLSREDLQEIELKMKIEISKAIDGVMNDI